MQTIIDLQNIAYSYPQSPKMVLEDIAFTLKEGETASLLGANGSGKSTIFKLLTGSLQPTSGRIIKKENISIAYISQNIHQSLFMDLTVQENLTLMRVKFSCQEQCLNYLKLYHRNLPLYLNQPVKMLSGGERQALVLAIKLHAEPDILLLDEHTSALDPEAESTLMELTHQKMSEHKITTLMCTHKLGLANKYSKRIIGLSKGKIVLDCKNKNQDLTKEKLDLIYREC